MGTENAILYLILSAFLARGGVEWQECCVEHLKSGQENEFSGLVICH